MYRKRTYRKRTSYSKMSMKKRLQMALKKIKRQKAILRKLPNVRYKRKTYTSYKPRYRRRY